ncbi:porin [Paraburkholderia sp. HD33-4]|uniref:porin n=1 Tax=Paraburkholderia sp. HD33-4 TaxID=2883242 RepID=UPI001F1D9848|nr:porin [Paraburkholderia sp. HD33-4]
MKVKIIAVTCFALCCGSAFAQSSVTLYGLMDAGITYTNNVVTPAGHGSNVQFVSGSSQGDRWGLKGSEDLGGGLKAVFVLENGFQLGTGALGQGGLMFGRQAYVGLVGPWGTLTLGRQYDFIGDNFWAYAMGAMSPAGLLAWSLPAYAAGGYTLDNRIWGDEVNNAVKYQSPTIGGFTFGAMYGFGNVAGSLGTNSSSNFMISYGNGPFSAALAYMSIHNATPSSNSTEYAGGASYAIGKSTLFGNITDVQLTGGDRPRATTFDAGASYALYSAFNLAAAFQYQKRNNDLGSANQVIVTADYLLSKRTDVYMVATLGHDHAFGAQVQAAYGAPSSSDVQTGVRVGIRHRF